MPSSVHLRRGPRPELRSFLPWDSVGAHGSHPLREGGPAALQSRPQASSEPCGTPSSPGSCPFLVFRNYIRAGGLDTSRPGKPVVRRNLSCSMPAASPKALRTRALARPALVTGPRGTGRAAVLRPPEVDTLRTVFGCSLSELIRPLVSPATLHPAGLPAKGSHVRAASPRAVISIVAGKALFSAPFVTLSEGP